MTHEQARLKLDVLREISHVLVSNISGTGDTEEKKKLLEELWKLHAQPLSGGGPGEK